MSTFVNINQSVGTISTNSGSGTFKQTFRIESSDGVVDGSAGQFPSGAVSPMGVSGSRYLHSITVLLEGQNLDNYTVSMELLDSSDVLIETSATTFNILFGTGLAEYEFLFSSTTVTSGTDYAYRLSAVRTSNGTTATNVIAYGSTSNEYSNGEASKDGIGGFSLLDFAFRVTLFTEVPTTIVNINQPIGSVFNNNEPNTFVNINQSVGTSSDDSGSGTFKQTFRIESSDGVVDGSAGQFPSGAVSPMGVSGSRYLHSITVLLEGQNLDNYTVSMELLDSSDVLIETSATTFNILFGTGLAEYEFLFSSTTVTSGTDYAYRLSAVRTSNGTTATNVIAYGSTSNEYSNGVASKDGAGGFSLLDFAFRVTLSGETATTDNKRQTFQIESDNNVINADQGDFSIDPLAVFGVPNLENRNLDTITVILQGQSSTGSNYTVSMSLFDSSDMLIETSTDTYDITTESAAADYVFTFASSVVTSGSGYYFELSAVETGTITPTAVIVGGSSTNVYANGLASGLNPDYGILDLAFRVNLSEITSSGAGDPKITCIDGTSYHLPIDENCYCLLDTQIDGDRLVINGQCHIRKNKKSYFRYMYVNYNGEHITIRLPNLVTVEQSEMGKIAEVGSKIGRVREFHIQTKKFGLMKVAACKNKYKVCLGGHTSRLLNSSAIGCWIDEKYADPIDEIDYIVPIEQMIQDHK